MPSSLKRFQREGDDRFVTFSCYRREAYVATASFPTTDSPYTVRFRTLSVDSWANLFLTATQA